MSRSSLPLGDTPDRRGDVATHHQHSEYVLTKDWIGEHERLRLLEATVDPLSIDAIRAGGFGPSSRCLEVGAGSGSIAEWLARETGDPELVTTTDIDARLLTPLAGSGIRVLQHDVAADTFPPASFDVVHARAVFEHIAKRDDVVGRIVPWLAPDGVLVVVDCASFPVSSSRNPIFRKAMHAWVDVLGLTGTDYQWARSFPEPLQRHGFRDVGLSTMVPPIQGGTPVAKFWSLTLETIRARILDAGLMCDAEISETKDLLADPTFFELGPAFVATWGRRPL